MSIEEVPRVYTDGYISSLAELDRDFGWQRYISDRIGGSTIRYDQSISAGSCCVDTVTQEERSTATTHKRLSDSASSLDSSRLHEDYPDSLVHPIRKSNWPHHRFSPRAIEGQRRTARSGSVMKVTHESSHGGENRQIKAIRQPSQEVCDVCRRRKVKCNIKDYCLHRGESGRPTDANT
jgi:hypothetical protein